jgi:hypothetical protein
MYITWTCHLVCTATASINLFFGSWYKALHLLFLCKLWVASSNQHMDRFLLIHVCLWENIRIKGESQRCIISMPGSMHYLYSRLQVWLIIMQKARSLCCCCFFSHTFRGMVARPMERKTGKIIVKTVNFLSNCDIIFMAYSVSDYWRGLGPNVGPKLALKKHCRWIPNKLKI